MSITLSPIQFAEVLLAWWSIDGRHDLPWQQDTSPYRVWVSEIMLQQTQVVTVVPYFNRFMQTFPDLSRLAQASEDKILALWSGLGYYQRARRLHQTARIIVERHRGQWPTTSEGLQRLPGIGRSTAGAILAMAMHQKATILDGNVKRILMRFHAINTPAQSSQTLKVLWDYAERYTPVERVHHYTQAIMDLGATLCLPKRPFCHLCPLKIGCQAYQQGNPGAYPSRTTAKKFIKALKERHVVMLIIYRFRRDDEEGLSIEVALQQRPSIGIWARLWSFPEYPLFDDQHPDDALSEQAIQQWCQHHHNLSVISQKKLPGFEHVLTHRRLHITPVVIHTKVQSTVGVQDSLANRSTIWYTQREAQQCGLPAPVRRLLQAMPSYADHDHAFI